MFRYEIVALENGAAMTLVDFEAPWADSLPIFHLAAEAYFAVRGKTAASLLDFYATLEGEGQEPDRRALVCSAAPVNDGATLRVEIIAGPLLAAALRRACH